MSAGGPVPDDEATARCTTEWAGLPPEEEPVFWLAFPIMWDGLVEHLEQRLTTLPAEQPASRGQGPGRRRSV